MKDNPLVEIEIELEQKHSPYTTGRNGTFGIGKLRLWEGTGRCFIDFFSLRTGALLNAGAMIESSDMDRLAADWLLARGFVIRKEPTALIPMTYDELIEDAKTGVVIK